MPKTLAQKMNNTQNGIPLKCPKCGYFWDYNGEKRGKERATCPSCSRKVKVKENRQDKI